MTDNHVKDRKDSLDNTRTLADPKPAEELPAEELPLEDQALAGEAKSDEPDVLRLARAL